MQTIKRISAYAWRDSPRRLVFVYLLATGATLATVAQPRVMGEAVDAVLESASISEIWLWAGLIFLLALLYAVFGYGRSYLSEVISRRIGYTLREHLYDRLHKLSFSFHDQQHTGDLMSRATADVEVAVRFVQSSLIRAPQHLLSFALITALILFMDWSLGLIVLCAIIPLVFIVTVDMGRRFVPLGEAVQRSTGEMTTALHESLTNVKVVKAFGAEEHEARRFGRHVDDVFNSSFMMERVRALRTALIQLIFMAATAVVVWWGGRSVVQGDLTPGDLTQLIFYVVMLTNHFRSLARQVPFMVHAASAGKRVFEVLDQEPAVRERADAEPLANVRGHIRFESVSFTYAGSSRPAVKDVSLDVEPSQLVVVTGEPGAGKSSLMSLLARFYDVEAGRITIDGTDVRDATIDSVRRSVGIVHQDVFLFGGTVRENISYGRPDASLEDVIDSAKTAQVHDEITALSDGYDTVIGERGVELSGGQRQRLALARTLLLDPSVLVLDDTMSSVDSETEELMRQSLLRAAHGRTTFIVTHRPAIASHADLLVVMRDGKIVECGPPERLLHGDGMFARIAGMQAGLSAAETGRARP